LWPWGLWGALKAETIEYLNEHPGRIVSLQQGWGEPGLGVSAHLNGQKPLPLQIGTKTYDRGIGTHANGEMVLDLDPSCLRFESEVGVQANQPSGSVVFQVWLDNRMVWDSGVVRTNEEARPVKVDLAGARWLKLKVTDAATGLSVTWPNGRMPGWSWTRPGPGIAARRILGWISRPLPR